MKRPIESDYTSQVAYTRALEEYCDMLEQPSVGELLIFSKDLKGMLERQAATLPAAQRKPLTDEEIEKIYYRFAGYGGDDFLGVARAIEAAHGIKENT